MSECRDPEITLACFVDAAGVCKTLKEVTVFNAVGAPHAIYFLDEAGAVVDTSVGSVTAGECKQHVTVETAYDVLANGDCIEVEIVKTFDCAGTATVTYLTIAGLPYVPVGDLSFECPCKPVPALGVITNLALL